MVDSWLTPTKEIVNVAEALIGYELDLYEIYSCELVLKNITNI